MDADDVVALDAGDRARLLETAAPPSRPPLRPLSADQTKAFEALLARPKEGPPRLPAPLEKAARALLESAVPASLAGAGREVTARWLSSLAPLEPVIVRADRRR